MSLGNTHISKEWRTKMVMKLWKKKKKKEKNSHGS